MLFLFSCFIIKFKLALIYNNIILLITKLINILFYKNIYVLSKILLDSFSIDFVIIKK